MKHVTLVVEDAAEPIHLGMQLAGGRVTAAGIGDYSLYCELMEAAKDLVLLIKDGAPIGDAVLEAAAQTVRDLTTKLDDAGDGLQSELGSLRKDAERYRGVRRVANRQGLTDEQFDQQTDSRVGSFDTAMAKERGQ